MITRNAIRITVNTQAGIPYSANISAKAFPNTAPSTDPASELQRMYPPTIQMIVTNGPTQASENCASPPVRFGIRAFNSAMDNNVKMLTRHAITIVMMNVVPMLPAPIPRVNKQLDATTSPTPVATTLANPIFFSSISTTPP